MKQYIKYITTIIILTIIIFETIVVGIIMFPPGKFHSYYTSIIVDGYRKLQNTNEPKIIMVSGSSSAFGLDQKMLENATGYEVVNLGVHAGFGHLFPSELSKENINEGDIVLLGYEYGWQDGFDFLGQDLIMAGIDENIDMYKHIPVSHWGDFLGYIFKYANDKDNSTEHTGIYSREAFDDGQMTMDRFYEMDYANNMDAYSCVDITGVQISDNSVEYLTEYKKFVEDKGAKCYFVAPPLLKQAVKCDYIEFKNLKNQEEDLIGIPYISNPEDYFFEDELMSNSIYHCSKEGERIRTEKLIEDLERANVI